MSSDYNQNPAPGSAPVPPRQPEHVRRVGTLTMGLALIGVGILTIYSLIRPGIENLEILKYTPVLLIALGVEIIVYSLLGRNLKLRYDFLSMLVCLMLIGGALLVSVIPQYAYNWGPQRRYVEIRMETELYDRCYDALKGTGIRNLDVDLTLANPKLKENMSVYDLTAADRPRLTITLADGYATPLAFAEAGRSIMDRLKSLEIPVAAVNFTSYDPNYSLRVEGRFDFDKTAAELEHYVVYDQIEEAEPAEVPDEEPEETSSDDDQAIGTSELETSSSIVVDQTSSTVKV